MKHLLVTIFLFYSIFAPLSVPGFVLCFGADGHLALEPEMNAAHSHLETSKYSSIFIYNNPDIPFNQTEDCMDISLDKYESFANSVKKQIQQFYISYSIESGSAESPNLFTNSIKENFTSNSKTSYNLVIISSTILLI